MDTLQERFGDMRMKMAFQILSLWSHLGELKQNFIPGGWVEIKRGGNLPLGNRISVRFLPLRWL